MKNTVKILLGLFLLLGCKSNQVVESKQNYSANRKIIIYKTTHDYTKYVPVIMNASKTEIVSYPAPADLDFNGQLTTPTKLVKGYLLDNRGINENVVFLKYSYEEYFKLKDVPSLSELKKNILEKYPLSELIYCEHAVNGKTTLKELNQLIESDFVGCKKVEITPLKVEL